MLHCCLAADQTPDVVLLLHRSHFLKDVRKQLYTDNDDRNFFNRIKDELKTVEQRLEDGKAALQHLEMFLINVACDDPGAAIGSQLALPILQERLDVKAMEFAAEKAREAEIEIIAMEVRCCCWLNMICSEEM